MEEQDCGTLLKQINDAMEKMANNALRSQGLTFSQMRVLSELSRAQEGQLSLKELEQTLHVAQSTAAGIISRLEAKGVVASAGDPKDRRVKLVRITAAGLELIQTSVPHRIEAEKQLLSGLTEAEQTIFYTLLKKVRDSLQ